MEGIETFMSSVHIHAAGSGYCINLSFLQVDIQSKRACLMSVGIPLR